MRSLSTLHVDLGEQWRGGQNQALLLALGVRSCGQKAELVAVRGAPLAERAKAAGIRVHEIVAWRWRAALRIRQLLGTSTFDVVHCHDAHGLTAASLAGAARHSRLIAARRVAYPLSRGRFALARYRNARRVIAVSSFVKQTVLESGLPEAQVEVIYDGVEVPGLPSNDERLAARQRWAQDSGSPLLGCVGFLLPEKGQEALIRALPMVLDRWPGCRLLLAGDGPCRFWLEKLARELGVEKSLHLAGFVNDVGSVYRALDVFLFPSLAEPLGSSLLAAMAHGLAPVGVASGAVPEVIEDGRNGLLVPSPDPAALGEAIRRLLEDRALAARLGAAARETVERRFGAGRMVRDTLDLYERVRAER